MKKGALATGALTLGSATVTPAAADGQQERVAAFSFRFYPGASFDVVAQLEQSTTVEVLQEEGQTVPEISQPDEWTGHIIRYDTGREGPGITAFLFIRGRSLNPGDSGTLATEASMLSSRLNLLSTSLEGGGGGGGGDGGGGNGGG